jgi:hypothetical protein
MENANDTRHYILLVIAIIIGLVGVFLRFAGDASVWSIASNIILIIGVIVAFKAVFAILK